MPIHYVEDHGAVGDGSTRDTAAIQQAIDAAHAEGGGTVVLSGGRTYLSGTIFLRSHIELRIERGARLLGSPDIGDYPVQDWLWWHKWKHGDYFRHLVIVEGCQNVAISGGGTIDGNGHHFWHEKPKPQERRWIKYDTPRVEMLLMLRRSKDVQVREITLFNSPAWNCHVMECDRVKIEGITIQGELFGPNIDGIDIDGSHNVHVHGCDIHCGDDGVVCFPSMERSCENITVSDCSFRTNCVGLKAYMWGQGVVRNLTFTNCVIHHSTRGVGLYLLEHGLIENVTVSNLVINTDSTYWCNRPLQIDAKEVGRGRELYPEGHFDSQRVGTIRNVLFSNIVCQSDGRILLTAADGMTIENVVLRDIIMDYPALDDPHCYPTSNSDQYANHSPEAQKARAALVADSVTGLTVDNLRTDWPRADKLILDWGGLKEDNGDHMPYPRLDDEPEPPFHAIWGRNIQGCDIRSPFASGHNGASAFDIEDSLD